MGPLYCETGTTWLFMTEPVNTISNAAIIIAAIFAFRAIRREGGSRLDAYALATTLFLTGIGSTLWHGTRIPSMLTFDVLPGILFLFLLTYLWMRKLYGPLQGGLGILALIGSIWSAGALLEGILPPGPAFLLPIFGGVLVVAAVFVALTYLRRGSRVAGFSLVVILSALTAAFFRTFDLYTCVYLPFGTHFLWHIFLSLAAYLGVRLILLLDTKSA